MTTAIFHVDNDYKELAEFFGYDVNQSSDYDDNCFKVTIKNVDLNALKVFTDWGDLASHYGLMYESIVYTEIE